MDKDEEYEAWLDVQHEAFEHDEEFGQALKSLEHLRDARNRLRKMETLPDIDFYQEVRPVFSKIKLGYIVVVPGCATSEDCCLARGHAGDCIPMEDDMTWEQFNAHMAAGTPVEIYSAEFDDADEGQ